MCMFCRSLFIFSEVRVTRSLVLCVCFVDRCLSFCSYIFGHCGVSPSFGHCGVSPSSIYGQINHNCSNIFNTN